MWMVDPAIMCRKHLLGEHVELHMLSGHLARGRMVAGYVANNCVEPAAIAARHKALAAELERRGYRHASPLQQPSIKHLSDTQRKTAVNVKASLADLQARCAACRILAQQQAGSTLRRATD